MKQTPRPTANGAAWVHVGPAFVRKGPKRLRNSGQMQMQEVEEHVYYVYVLVQCSLALHAGVDTIPGSQVDLSHGYGRDLATLEGRG